MEAASNLVVLEPGPSLAAVDPPAPAEQIARMQALALELAYEPDAWCDATRAQIAALFDERAETWATHRQDSRLGALRDALARGGVAPGGTCLEVGSGTGLITPALLERFDRVVSVDLSPQMLAHTPAGRAHLVLADASSLPLRPGSVAALVCVNCFLFPREYLRVLADDGAIVFVSTRGAATPIYLAPEHVLGALAAHGGSRWAATSADALGGTWTVVRRA